MMNLLKVAMWRLLWSILFIVLFQQVSTVSILSLEGLTYHGIQRATQWNPTTNETRNEYDWAYKTTRTQDQLSWNEQSRRRVFSHWRVVGEEGEGKGCEGLSPLSVSVDHGGWQPDRKSCEPWCIGVEQYFSHCICSRYWGRSLPVSN